MRSLEKGPAFPLLALRACHAMGASGCSITLVLTHNICMICGCSGTQAPRRAVRNLCRDKPAVWHRRSTLDTNSHEQKKKVDQKGEQRQEEKIVWTCRRNQRSRVVHLKCRQAVQQEESKRLMKSFGKQSANQSLFLDITMRMSYLPLTLLLKWARKPWS